MAAPAALPLAIIAILVPWAIYRRVRMNIGRQKLSARRLKVRITAMTTVLAVLAWPAVEQAPLDAGLALAAALAAGIAIAVLALRRTRFEQADGVEYYVPHLHIGLALTSLLLARMGWRLWEVYPALAAGAAMPAFGGLSPLTLGVIALIIAYNATFCLGLLRHIARTRAEPG